MFDDSNCLICQNIDCLTRCKWIKLDLKTAKEELNKMIKGEDSNILKECVTCFGCDEYCPYNSHPFSLISQLQEKYNSISIDPTFLESAINKNKPREEFKVKELDLDKPILNKCIFGKSHAKNMESKLFRGLQFVGGIDYYCNFVYYHYGKKSITKERASILLDKIKKQGIKEMICFHDECYQLFTKHFPQYGFEINFKVICLFEYLYKYLKDHESDIIKLNMKIAYQRPCSSRFIPEIDEWVDKICSLIGVERVARKYDRENGLCCAGVFALIGKKKIMKKTQDDNIDDMLSHNAEVCVYNCPMCMAAIGYKVEKKGLKNYLLSDLCRLAIGEKLE
jgi:Fe-S oxidoreductase